jgi:hypothetical protein
MVQNQEVEIGGAIGESYPNYAGIYLPSGNHTIDLNDGDFLQFEHTDGLNYVNTEFCRVDDISGLFKIKNTDKFQLNITEGLGAGLLYPKTNAKYAITLIQKNNFGTNIISKTITIPFDKDKVSDNPNGTVEFIPSGGPWKDTPISYDYIFTGDTGMDIDDYIYDGEVTITGYTKSNLLELELYGKTSYKSGVDVFKDGAIYGKVTNITDSFTAYTIQDIKYVDYPFGVTTFEVKSKGLTKDTAKLVPITKNEALLKSVDDVQIFSNVFVERGKNSGYEKVQRLGEVKTLQDMEKYGYERHVNELKLRGLKMMMS